MNTTQATILAVFLILALPIAIKIALISLQLARMAKRMEKPGRLEQVLETMSDPIDDEEPIMSVHPNWNSPEPVERRAPTPPPPPNPPPIQLCVCPLCGHHHRPSSER